MNLSRLKISTRLFLAFGTIVLLAVISSGIALLQLKGIQNSLDKIVTENNVKIALINSKIDAVHVVARVMRTVVITTDEGQKAAGKKLIEEQREKYDAIHAKVMKLQSSDAGKAKIAAIEAATAKARPLNNKVIELGVAGQVQEALTLLTAEAGPATQAWQDALADNLSFQQANNQVEYETALADYLVARNTLIFSALFSLLVAVALALWVVRSIVSQLGGEPADVAQLANAIADADLSSAITVRPGDTTSVVAAMARMQQALITIVGSVRGNADSVSTASAEIAQGNNDLSSRTEQQASALEETAASMEQLGATVRQNADNARQANQLALSASTVAAQGGEVVGLVVETMKGINDSSRRISDIIQVIDGIAFQTNILALNAAVEAARAGEQGRGFAVVASEVRSLAGRSADAAKEIKSLINASVERVEHGTALVDQAGNTMTEVVGSIRRVTDIMGEISAASNEQSLGVSQIGEAVTQMDQVTQQNAALVEEMAAAASSLKSQAQDLVQTVSVFKLGGHAAHHAMRTAAPTSYSRPAPPRAPLPRPAAPKLRTTSASRPAAPASLPSPKAQASKSTTAATTQSNDADWETF
ncbi:MAG: methyl-accepting chemotaxis protein [Rhodoferax sp.]|nr:methyl-accepting chemotaxis protein [Rhodoferax sp.]